VPNKIHKNARTTPKVRQEIQESNESNSKLARKFGIDIATVRKWRSRDFITDAPVTQKKTRFSFSPWQELLILHLRYYLYLGLDDLLTITNRYIKPNTSRSALSRLLKKHHASKMLNILPIPDDKPHGEHLKSSPMGTMQISVVPALSTKDRYLFITYEHRSRYLTCTVTDKAKASAWFKKCIKKSPLSIQDILLDNLVLSCSSDLLKMLETLQLPHAICTIARPQLYIPTTLKLNLTAAYLETVAQAFNLYTPLHALRNITPFAQCLALQQSGEPSNKKTIRNMQGKLPSKSEITVRIKKYVDVIYVKGYTSPIVQSDLYNESTQNENRKLKMANANETVIELMGTEGAVAAIIGDSDSGLVLASKSNGFDTETAAAGNTRVMQAKRDTMKMLNLNDSIEDILITLGKQLHLITPLPGNDAIFGYLVVDKKGANLGMARAQLKNAMANLAV